MARCWERGGHWGDRTLGEVKTEQDRGAARGRSGKLLARIAPAVAYGNDPERTRRARVTFIFAVTMTGVTLALASFQVLFGSLWIALVAGCGPLVTGASVVVLLVFRREGLAANLLCLAVLAALTVVVVIRGGVGISAANAFAGIPMLALVLADRRAGLIWLGLSVVALVGIAATEWVGVPMPAVEVSSPTELNVLGHIVFAILLFYIAAVYEYLWRRSLNDLERTQTDLLAAEKLRLESETEARLLRSNRMAELGTLATGVAHEINNPLTYVEANIGHLLTRPEGGLAEGDRVILEETLAGARQIKKIVRDIGLFSRIDGEEKTEALDIEEVLDSSVRLLWNQVKHRATLDKEYGEAPWVRGNASRLGQVFVNLVINAVQAIPEGRRGHIVIRTSAVGTEMVKVEVEDDGVGMPKELRQRALEPFFTTKPVGEGTGLGLSICYGIVTGLGGELTIEGEPGRGTKVTVTLPAAVEAEAEGGAVAEEAESSGSRHILVVDDDPLVGRGIARLLRDHDVQNVASAKEALETLEASPAFDAVLCDLMMPIKTGMELYAEATEKHPAMKGRFIFMTGGAFTQEARAFVEAFEGRCLDKPVALAKIEAALDALDL